MYVTTKQELGVFNSLIVLVCSLMLSLSLPFDKVR